MGVSTDVSPSQAMEQKAPAFSDRIAASVEARVTYFRDIGLLVADFFIALFKLKGHEWRYTKGLIIHQIIFSGIDTIVVISVVSALVGGVVMVQLLSFTPGFQADAILMKIMVGLITKEIAPIFTALILVGRSGSAIAVELGEMKIKRQDEALESMGIGMSQYFHVPRIIGLAVSNVMLNGYFVIMALVSWLGISLFQKNVDMMNMVNLLAGSLSISDVLINAFKGVALGTAIAIVCIHHGMSVKKSATEIPQRTSRAIVDSFLFCFIIDALISVAWYMAA